jgi:predicted SPOUT superfamily RNA methylase MTH1
MLQTIRVERYAYWGYHGSRSECVLRVFEEAGKATVVIATERDDNPGTSITNVAESLAWQVWCWLEKPSHGMVWVEHYADRAFIGRRPTLREQFDIVSFDVRSDGTFCNPKWKRVPKSEVERLVGRSLP